MGIFVERTPADNSAIERVIEDALRADPEVVGDAAEVRRRTSAAQTAAAATTPKFHWGRIVVGLAVGAALIGAGILLAIYADNRAIEDALRAVQNPGYTPPALGVSGIATTVLGLGSAWSGGLVGVLLSEK